MEHCRTGEPRNSDTQNTVYQETSTTIYPGVEEMLRKIEALPLQYTSGLMAVREKVKAFEAVWPRTWQRVKQQLQSSRVLLNIKKFICI